MALVMFGASISAWGASNSGKSASKRSAVIEHIGDGEIDWTNGMVLAVGEAVLQPASQEPNRALALLKAKTYARMIAIAHLLSAVQGTHIDYEATGKDLMDVNVMVREKIEGYVRQLETISVDRVTEEGDVIIRVTVGSRLYGKSAPGTALLREEAREMTESNRAPAKVTVDTSKSAVPETDIIPAEQHGPFTSLIVDVRGLDVARAMSPKIRKADGSEVWGTLPVTIDYAIETGILSYVDSLKSAKINQRCGANPLIIRAIGRAGGEAMCDVVVSEEDAARIQSENSKTKFADQCKVIFIVDPNR